MRRESSSWCAPLYAKEVNETSKREWKWPFQRSESATVINNPFHGGLVTNHWCTFSLDWLVLTWAVRSIPSKLREYLQWYQKGTTVTALYALRTGEGRKGSTQTSYCCLLTNSYKWILFWCILPNTALRFETNAATTSPSNIKNIHTKWDTGNLYLANYTAPFLHFRGIITSCGVV